MQNINWMEFKEVVPGKIDTVLLPCGTIEPHGVFNNGADITAPVAIAKSIAKSVNALIAPVIPYGITGFMDAFPGSFSISKEVYEPYVSEILVGLVNNGFRNIIIINGHGDPQIDSLNRVAEDVGRKRRVRTLVVNWWTYCSDITREVFGNNGGHGAINENAFIQAIDASLVHKERYKDALAVPSSIPGIYSSYPAPGSIILYKAGEGYVDFNEKKAMDYFNKVVEKVTKLILTIRDQWDLAGV